jgi:hypothetical protein
VTRSWPRQVGRSVAGLLAALATAVAMLLGGLASNGVDVVRAVEPPEVTGTTTLTVQPQKRRIHAEVELRIKNVQPNTISGGQTTVWSVVEWQLAVPDEATHVRVTRGGTRLPTTVRERDGFDEIRFDIRPRLAYGRTANVHITYDLPDGGARSSSPIRVGRAYVSFYAFAHGDDVATMRIELPEGYEVQTRGGDIGHAFDAEGRTILTTNGSVDDARWYVVVDGDRPDALEAETLQVEIDGQARVVEVRSWPEDDLWAERVRERLSDGLIALQELNGLDWPVVGPLRVTESATRSLEGYAGFYDPGEGRGLDEILISEEPDDMVIVHEGAHAWFNDGLLTGRWINEGLADAYAARALDRLGSPQPAPEPVFRDTPVAFALNIWAPPALIDSAAAQAREAYGYDAARQVIDALIDEIGEERMREVLAAADLESIAFAGAQRRESQMVLAGFRDWRYLLDLLQQIGGSTEAGELYETWVVSDVERPILADHEAAVRRYRQLVDDADDWLPSHALRAPMARWAFDVVDGELELAETALDRRASIEALEDRLGLDDGGALRTAFESAVISYDGVVSLADAMTEALRDVQVAHEAVAAERSPLVALGLVGLDPALDLGEAGTAYRSGDLHGARTQAAEAVALIKGADDVGTQRAATAGGVAFVVILFGVGAVVVQRRRRRLASESASQPDHQAWVGPPEAPATLAARTEPAAPDEPGQAGATEGQEET